MASRVGVRNVLRAGACALAAWLMVGCSSSYSSMPAQVPALEDRDRVVYRDASLKVNLAVVDVVQDRVNGVLRIRAKLRNLGRGGLNTEVQATFVDKDNMEIGTAMWTPFPMSGGATKVFESIASSNNAVDCHLFVRLAGGR